MSDHKADAGGAVGGVSFLTGGRTWNSATKADRLSFSDEASDRNDEKERARTRARVHASVHAHARACTRICSCM